MCCCGGLGWGLDPFRYGVVDVWGRGLTKAANASAVTVTCVWTNSGKMPPLASYVLPDALPLCLWSKKEAPPTATWSPSCREGGGVFWVSWLLSQPDDCAFWTESMRTALYFQFEGIWWWTPGGILGLPRIKMVAATRDILFQSWSKFWIDVNRNYIWFLRKTLSI